MRVIYLFIIGVIITSIANAQTIYPSGVPGCIARWTFDSEESGLLNSLPDMSGNGNNGVTTNILSTPGFRNKPLKAGSFDGSTSWAEVAHKSMLNPTEITIVSLVKFNGYNNALCEFSQIVSKGYPYLIPGNYGQGIGDNYYDGNCGVFSPNFTQLGSQIGSASISFTPGNYVALNKWYFFATTIGNTSIKQYQIEMDSNSKAPNCNPINALNGTFNLGTNTQNISIGKHLNPSYPYWVNGEMDEVILFNRVLSESELYGIYEYLWGWATSTSNVEDLNSVFNSETRGHIFKLITLEQNYSLEIYNSLGQTLIRKNNCMKNLELDLTQFNSQILLIKIKDSKGKIHYIKKVI
ncbi:MAG TPA: hypothetical protein PLU17_04235 [Chitinophagaceae bacterium]|nr:hypothetical protein [Chitinophagaceae bacterium]